LYNAIAFGQENTNRKQQIVLKIYRLLRKREKVIF